MYKKNSYLPITFNNFITKKKITIGKYIKEGYEELYTKGAIKKQKKPITIKEAMLAIIDVSFFSKNLSKRK
jgi:hypothetical protein